MISQAEIFGTVRYVTYGIHTVTFNGYIPHSNLIEISVTTVVILITSLPFANIANASGECTRSIQ